MVVQNAPIRVHGPVIAVEKSANGKTGTVSATYVSQASCAHDCALRDAGCYAETGITALHTMRVNDSLMEDAEDIAMEESDGIDGLTGKYPLRLHVVGDCPTDGAAQIVSGAASRYTERGGGKAWSYTHAWRRVARKSWGSVSVSASCESADDIAAAKAKGYSTVVVYDSHTTGDKIKAFTMRDSNGVEHKIIPCLHQNGRTNCVGCPNLCRNDQNMRDQNISVGFDSHGARANTVRKTVNAKQS